jgi:hypothetical protein
MSDYDTVLFVARECFVYRVPPRASTAGYKAGEWGDMEAFLWKGRLRIMEKGDQCSIRLEDGENGELFAECPYDITGTSVEPVLDSSRYFVLRVESQGPNGQMKKAYIGMGVSGRSYLHPSSMFVAHPVASPWHGLQCSSRTEVTVSTST